MWMSFLLLLLIGPGSPNEDFGSRRATLRTSYVNDVSTRTDGRTSDEWSTDPTTAHRASSPTKRTSAVRDTEPTSARSPEIWSSYGRNEDARRASTASTSGNGNTGVTPTVGRPSDARSVYGRDADGRTSDASSSDVYRSSGGKPSDARTAYGRDADGRTSDSSTSYDYRSSGGRPSDVRTAYGRDADERTSDSSTSYNLPSGARSKTFGRTTHQPSWNHYETTPDRALSEESDSATNENRGFVDKYFEKSLISLASPTMNISFLTAAPQAALLVNSLSLVAASTLDVSLENTRTQRFIRRLTTPRSFRASVYQTVQAISDAFRVAHNSMLAIHLSLEDVPNLMTSMIEAYANPSDRSSTFLMKLHMHSFVDIVRKCKTESMKAAREFNDTQELIHELAYVTTATANEKQKEVQEATRKLMELDKEKQIRIREKQRKQSEMKYRYSVLENALKKKNQKKTNESDSNSAFGYLGLFLLFGRSFGSSNKDAAETTKEMYNKERELLREIQLQQMANLEVIANFTAKIDESSEELLQFEDLVAYLPRGVKILNDIQEEWTTLQNFFESLHIIVVQPILENLEAIEAEKSSTGRNGMKSNQLALSVIESASICISLAKTANIYNAVSNKFVLPIIDASTSQLVQTREKAKVALRKLGKKMAGVTSDAKTFIEIKLIEAERATKEQIEQFKQEFDESRE